MAEAIFRNFLLSLFAGWAEKLTQHEIVVRENTNTQMGVRGPKRLGKPGLVKCDKIATAPLQRMRIID